MQTQSLKTHLQQSHLDRINKYSVARKVWADLSFTHRKRILKRLKLKEHHASKDLQQIPTDDLQDIVFDLTIACTRS